MTAAWEWESIRKGKGEILKDKINLSPFAFILFPFEKASSLDGAFYF